MLLERALGKAPHVTQVDEVVAQLSLGDAIGRESEMLGQLPHRSDVGLLRALRKPRELDVLDQAFAQFGHRDILQTGSKMKTPAPRPGNPRGYHASDDSPLTPRKDAYPTNPAAKPLRPITAFMTAPPLSGI